MIEGGRPCDMILSEKKDAKRSNTQDRVKRRKARMTMKLDVQRPFAHMGRVIITAMES